MQEQEKKPPFKVVPNTPYYITLNKKFGEYDNKYGKSFGYGIRMRKDVSETPVEETYFASQAVYDLIMASKVEYETEFELIFNEKDSKKFYTLDGRTTNQWLAKGLNDEAESPTKAEQMIQTGQDELDALFGENSSVDNKAKIMLLKSELQKIVKLVDEL